MANDRLRGLLSFDPDDPNSQGLLGLGAALLQASGPSREPVSMGQALGQGLQGMQQARQQAMQQQMAASRMNAGQGQPSTVQEWEYFNKLSPQDQARFLEMKRNPNIMNLGGQLAVRSPGGGIGETYEVTPSPEQMPSFKGEQAAATAQGAETGRARSLLEEMEANLPRLETVASQLSDLGSSATYTKTGQALDFALRESGFGPRKEAIARREYISKVDNEVLPLLRQTFGSAFTEKEGESLRATLGDKDASPSEKDAILRSFIDSKRAQVETNRRRLGVGSQQPPAGNAEKPRAGGPQNGNGVITVDW